MHRNSYRDDAVQLAGHTELRYIITQQHGVHMDHRDVLHQPVVHILDLVTHTNIYQKKSQHCLVVLLLKGICLSK